MLMTHDKSYSSKCLWGLLLATCFALGCQELFDSDVWWHIRAGQWIREHGQVPALDPFTFASADRPWIDLHWLFQVILSGAFGLAGVAVLSCWRRRCAHWSSGSPCPRAAAPPFWLAGLMLAAGNTGDERRFDPRPELFSLAGIATFLYILARADRTPASLGTSACASRVGQFPRIVRARSHPRGCLYSRLRGCAAQVLVGSLSGAGALVALACLANPYGWRGALFPLELFPKITAWGGPYKAYVAEFMDMRSYIAKVGPVGAAANLYFGTQCFLLGVLPLSFIVPSVWRLAASPRSKDQRPGTRDTALWAGGFTVALGLVAVWVLGFPGVGPTAGRSIPA